MDYLSFPAFLMILIPVIAVLTATHSFKLFFDGLRVALFPSHELAEEICKKAENLFRLLSKTAMLAAAISFLISLVNLNFNLFYRADVNFPVLDYVPALAVNIAASLIPLHIGLILVVGVSEPIVMILKKKVSL